mmetsp:Transcript_10037/g.15097  ORF Transcript_10037/g.15097 Transcript_10037/m.15097 type:complete len:425 (+) Transcript_10037:231-1505(+)|eukprot:CAMPEP_0171461192 /NCGR_PEP_ID=MMETSP0945-20130129/5744_1 /TAXON_ID=109269 /ORGANISM="Vaucheria litorea, Strain CCMP2940" /LENGTH=424 /DNA_ID=CAMNT_0011987501 /DNA_START=73 /DNA_END=1347 /DNA_ORIENTATION=+
MSQKAITFLMVSVPEGKNNAIKGSLKENEILKIDHPELMIGTLDTLISLSDELVRVDSMVENFVRKIEKQYSELEEKNVTVEILKIGNNLPHKYLKKFEWDQAKYTIRQPLTNLVSGIQSSVAKYEEELRNLSASYSEKNQLYQSIMRVKKAGVMNADPNEVLKEEHLRGIEFYDTEYLLTLVVAVPKSMKKNWEENYATIGSDIAAMGCPNWSSSSNGIGLIEKGNYGPEFSERSKVKMSPVVPDSSRLIMEDSEGALYTVTVLKGQYQSGFYDGDEFQPGMYIDYVDAFKKAAKEKRFNAREYKYDPEKSGISENEKISLKKEKDKLNSNLTNWCKTHFGEVMVAWVHIKVVRLFVDSILQYGLPPKFEILLIDPKKKEKEILQKLDEICHQKESHGSVLSEDKTEKDEYHPYVVTQITVIG